jgi:hypothetical protein
MGDIDIRNYKCVPLDLLKNIGKNANGNDIINVTSDEKTLKDFKKEQDMTIAAAGPEEGGLSGDALENYIVGITVTFAILILLVVFYWGFLNLRGKGIGAFSLPEQLRTLPAIMLFSLIFAVVGFLIGSLVKF